MTPAAAIVMLDRQIAAHGEAVTLRRIGSPADTTLAVRGFVRRTAVEPIEPGGDAAQGTTTVMLSPTGLTLTPARGDQADLADGRVSIEEAIPVRMAGTIVRWNLKVMG